VRKDLYQELYDLEKNYWWHVGKREIVFPLIKNYTTAKDTALDIGCGAGLVVERLEEFFKEVWGLDSSPEALKFCQARGLKNLILSSAERVNMSSEKFDLITALDVLEHLDDESCLKECHRLLRNGGTMVVSVPSYPALWSYWDQMLGHKRRYTKATLGNALKAAGFTVAKISYSNSFILLPVLAIRGLKKLFKRKQAESDFIPTPEIIDTILKRIYKIESLLVSKAFLPAGLSIVAVAKKI
jgi:2-polyprenyl-3-methyl-5-hydroxy-6-metoxy-1,4-benzoquinol methylase